MWPTRPPLCIIAVVPDSAASSWASDGLRCCPLRRHHVPFRWPGNSFLPERNNSCVLPFYFLIACVIASGMLQAAGISLHRGRKKKCNRVPVQLAPNESNESETFFLATRCVTPLSFPLFMPMMHIQANFCLKLPQSRPSLYFQAWGWLHHCCPFLSRWRQLGRS